MSNLPSNQNRQNDAHVRNANNGPRANQAAQAPTNEERPETYNWQIGKRSLRERFEFLFNNEALADVHFIVGTESARIPAHKLGKVYPRKDSGNSQVVFVFQSWQQGPQFLMHYSTVVWLLKSKR